MGLLSRAAYCGGDGGSSRCCSGCSLRWLLLWTWALGHPGSVVAALGLPRLGSVPAARGLGCSETCGILPDQDSTRVSYVDRWVLTHPATRRAFISFFVNIGFFKAFIFFNLLQYCFQFMFSFFGQEIGGILTPQPGIEPSPTALEGKALTVGASGKS